MPVIDTSSGAVEYVEAGAGVPVVYFHGTGITCDGMLPIEAPLADSGFRVIIFNRPGYGRTPMAHHFTATACASVACALMDALEIGTACIMGSSGGAAFATSFAVNYPERTDCLILLCPQLHRWSDKSWLPAQSRWTLPLLRNRWLRKVLLNLYGFQFRRTTVDQFMKLEAGTRYEGVRDDPTALHVCKQSRDAMVNGPAHPGFENDMIVFTTEDIVVETTRIASPTLILHDRQDPMAPVAHVEWLASFNPHCQCVSLHSAGHLVWAGPDAGLMHDTRVRFMTEHAKRAA